MILRIPDYYKEFRCKADQCKDSCCVGWEIDIDEATYEYYHQVPGAFGERLRTEIRKGKDTSFRLKHGRCPFLNDKNLCDIVTELGETALCEICTEYPRFTLEYNNVTEKCLGLSCEEAGRLILLREDPIILEEYQIEEELSLEGEDISEEARALELARNHCVAIVQNRKLDVTQRIACLLLFSEQVQLALNEKQEDKIPTLIAQYASDELAKRLEEYKTVLRDQSQLTSITQYQLFLQRFKVFTELEVLDEEWTDTLSYIIRCFDYDLDSNIDTSYENQAKKFLSFIKDREVEYENLIMSYLLRYVLKSIYDYDFLGKVKFGVASYLMIRDMDMERYHRKDATFTTEDRIDTARIYSKEVEHSEDNLEQMADAFLYEDIFHTDSMIYQVLLGAV